MLSDEVCGLYSVFYILLSTKVTVAGFGERGVRGINGEQWK
jgi:hypothetical protein